VHVNATHAFVCQQYARNLARLRDSRAKGLEGITAHKFLAGTSASEEITDLLGGSVVHGDSVALALEVEHLDKRFCGQKCSTLGTKFSPITARPMRPKSASCDILQCDACSVVTEALSCFCSLFFFA